MNDGTLSYAAYGELIGVSEATIKRRLGELNPEEVCAKFAHTTRHGAVEGKMQVQEVVVYNLDVIISIPTR